LARALGKPLTAVDACAPFLAELEQEAGARGLTSLIKPLCLDFSELDFRPASFDLLWSEGAIYTLGWKPGLRAWAPLVRSGGFLAITEAVWLTEDPPPPAVAYWASGYPAMTTMARCAEQAASLGLELVESFPLPGQAWRDYYAPLAQRCEEWASSADPALGHAIAETQAEMALHERYGHCYGYAFFVLRVP
jgi:serine/threonine-protein kinase HipA